METKHKTTFTLAEFRALRERRAAEPVSADELERRRGLAEQSDRILASQKPLPIPVEELVRQAQRYGE